MKTPLIKLKEKRLEKGYTQQKLSELTGIKQESISRYESGEQFPRRKAFEKLAEALECSIGELI